MNNDPSTPDDYHFDELSRDIKTEGVAKVEDETTCLTKIEDQEEINPDLQLFQFSCYSDYVNKRFEVLLLSLEEYLEKFISVEDFILHSAVLSKREIQELISESKKHFKEQGTKIIRALGDDLKSKAAQHILPDSHLVQIIDATKRRIFNSYKQLKKNLTETLDKMSNKVSVKEPETKPQKKIIRRKGDFPQKARAILKSWFIAHAQDPYPSHEEKIELARESGISIRQLENWLTNTRGRIWKKMQPERNFGSEVQDFLFKNEEEL